MNGVLANISALNLTGPGATWANEITFYMNHPIGIGTILISRHVDLQSNELPLLHGYNFDMSLEID